MDAARALFIYAAVTALVFWNLVPVARTHLYADLGDPLLNTAILAWNARHVPLSAEWWNFPSFAPFTGVTAFTEHLLATYPIASPIIWVTNNPVLAYNSVFLIAFPANGVAMYLLVHRLTGSRGAAFIGGLAGMLAPYQSGHVSHAQTLWQFGMPLALLGLHSFLESGQRRHLVLLGTGWLVACAANAYTLVFFPILIGLWCLWFIHAGNWRTRFIPIGATIAVATLPLVPLLLGYADRQSAFGLARDYAEVRSFALDVSALASVSHRLVFWRNWLPTSFGETAVFPGLTIVALCIFAVWTAVRDRSRPRSPWPRRLGLLALAFAALALARALAGPEGWQATFLPAFRPYRVFTFGVIAAIAALLTTPRFRHAWRSRSVPVFYAVAIVVLWLLALGPEPIWHGERILTYGPYRLFYSLPGVQAIRVPARIWLVAVQCLAVLAGCGAAVLLQHVRRKRAVAAAAVVLILAEGWFTDTAQPVPAALPAGAVPPGSIAIALPVDDIESNTTAQYRAVMGGYRSINGYSGYSPNDLGALGRELRVMSDAPLNRYRQQSDLYVAVAFNDERDWDAWIARQSGAQRVAETGGTRIYRLPQLGVR